MTHSFSGHIRKMFRYYLIMWTQSDHLYSSLWRKQDNKLPFLNVLVTHREQGFRSSVYRKPTFTGQYLDFNSHHPYTVKKGIVHCLQHQANTISSDTDAYQKEISLRHNIHHNNYPECITLAPRNLDRRIEDNTPKLSTVCLPYIKGRAKRIQKICSPDNIRTAFTSGSTLQRYLFWVKLPTEFNMIKNCLLHLLQLWWDRSSTKSKVRRALEGCSMRWDWKVGYGGPYMERKEKQSALMGWSWNNW